MKNFKIEYKPDCRLSRNERRAYERKVQKAYEKAKTIPTNQAFENIKPDLIEKGWIYDERFGNVVENMDNVTLKFSPALRLVNAKFNITLIPHKFGIEISRLEVWSDYQHQGYGSSFLENLLKYLMNKGIDEIYVLPYPAGLGKSKMGLEMNLTELQMFFNKRGFMKQKGTPFFAFNIGLFKSFNSSMEVDNAILARNSSVVKDSNMTYPFQVHFEFVGESNKNFIEKYSFHSYECIKNTIERFKEDLTSEDMTSMSIRLLINEVLESDSLSKELSENLQSLFGVLLAEFAERNDYQITMSALGGILAGILFLYYRGIENHIDAFCFLFDQTKRTLEVGIHYAAESENIFTPYYTN